MVLASTHSPTHLYSVIINSDIQGGKKRAAGSPPSRSPQIKRKRTPAEYYQSDVIEAISKSPAARTPVAGKELFYDKGSYLAVRNESGEY